ncbi:hypothetical protein BDV32DRAFT_42171 [Aspergillus pseudonomiae]|nr:hypothetical protein BDV32DRAFT_42171 [Aspergillus pseudonomiae]
MPRVLDPFILSKIPNLLNLAWINRRHDLPGDMARRFLMYGHAVPNKAQAEKRSPYPR